jgi:hypothetical protein
MSRRRRVEEYIFVIGDAEDFDTMDDVISYITEGGTGKKAASYAFEMPKNCDESIAALVGRGIAFSAGWRMDNTNSCTIKKAGR